MLWCGGFLFELFKLCTFAPPTARPYIWVNVRTMNKDAILTDFLTTIIQGVSDAAEAMAASGNYYLYEVEDEAHNHLSQHTLAKLSELGWERTETTYTYHGDGFSYRFGKNDDFKDSLKLLKAGTAEEEGKKRYTPHGDKYLTIPAPPKAKGNATTLFEVDYPKSDLFPTAKLFREYKGLEKGQITNILEWFAVEILSESVYGEPYHPYRIKDSWKRYTITVRASIRDWVDNDRNSNLSTEAKNKYEERRIVRLWNAMKLN